MMRADKSSGQGATMDVFLCNNYRHVLMSLATIARTDRKATLIYLEDVLPLPAAMRERLAAACPDVTFLVTRDADQMAAFARLPRVFPAILRRNLSFGGPSGLLRPQGWDGALLRGQHFGTGYVYHAGFFVAKVVAGHCDQVVLREDGLNNYVGLDVPPLKAVLRALSGLTARHQVWGEERWIDRVEVSHPENLPTIVQAKAVKLTFRDVMDVLPPTTVRAIAAAFLPDAPVLDTVAKTALLLTQPIDTIGICSVVEKTRVYGRIADVLANAGYQVYVKPHPTETNTAVPGTQALPPAFPVEAWPYITDQKFTLAVALCSAALVTGARAFADRTTQLLAPAEFNADHFADWPGLIAPALAKALQR